MAKTLIVVPDDSTYQFMTQLARNLKENDTVIINKPITLYSLSSEGIWEVVTKTQAKKIKRKKK